MPIVRGFRRFQSNIVSSRQVVSELSRGKNVQQSGWCSSAPSTPKRKKITTADRRALLESFVNKYRAMNSGKFPTPTSAKKEVGGGYYFVKKVLQEIEYNFKLSSMDKEAPVKETKKQPKGEDTVSMEIAVKSSTSQQVSNSQITMDQNLYEDAWLESAGNSDHKKSQRLQQSSSSDNNTGNSNITRDDTHNIATENHHDTRAECHEKLENHARDESLLEDKYDSKVEQQHDAITRDMPETRKDEELREKALTSSSSLWGNLKSLASGFINIWKKQ